MSIFSVGYTALKRSVREKNKTMWIMFIRTTMLMTHSGLQEYSHPYVFFLFFFFLILLLYNLDQT